MQPFWQVIRKPWTFESGGPDSGVYKSTDGGDTWKEITSNPGLPKGVIGRIGIAVSPVKSGSVWLNVEAEDGGVFHSDDGGATWTKVNDEREDQATGVVLLAHLRRSEKRRHRLRREHQLLQVDRRRPHLQGDSDATWRQSRSLDRERTIPSG